MVGRSEWKRQDISFLVLHIDTQRFLSMNLMYSNFTYRSSFTTYSDAQIDLAHNAPSPISS